MQDNDNRGIIHIYDKAFKRILTLSNKSVINLVNGLFHTNYPTNSEITYNWTESEDHDLNRTLADSILTINHRDSYHIEAQMTKDKEIVFRAFSYGFGHAYKNRIVEKGGERLDFPEPCIIYLDEGNMDSIPDTYNLIINFGGQGEFVYKVPVLKLQNMSSKELNDRKLIILIPFKLLKLRKKIEKSRCKENMEELRHLVMDDIIPTIDKNAELGNISANDAVELIELITKLYKAIYARYNDGEVDIMRMVDRSLTLYTDKFDKTVDELREEIAKKNEVLNQMDAAMAQKDAAMEAMAARIQELEAKLSV